MLEKGKNQLKPTPISKIMRKREKPVEIQLKNSLPEIRRSFTRDN
jgi:hypothetical protein